MDRDECEQLLNARQALSDIQSALTMIECPYRVDDGVCVTGCRTEPECQTCEPAEGWEPALHEGVEKLSDALEEER